MEKNNLTLALNRSVDSFLQKIHFLNPVDKRNLSRCDGTGTRSTVTLRIRQ
jgi:hypothetical protein